MVKVQSIQLKDFMNVHEMVEYHRYYWNLKVTPEEIEKHHFQIERSPESLINQNF